MRLSVYIEFIRLSAKPIEFDGVKRNIDEILSIVLAIREQRMLSVQFA
jgi:hypothetical protein